MKEVEVVSNNHNAILMCMSCVCIFSYQVAHTSEPASSSKIANSHLHYSSLVFPHRILCLYEVYLCGFFLLRCCCGIFKSYIKLIVPLAIVVSQNEDFKWS